MYYIDTNVIISYLNKKDVNHSRALKIVEKGDNMITSPIGILELRSVLSRGSMKRLMRLSGIDSYKVFIDDFGGRNRLLLEIVKP